MTVQDIRICFIGDSFVNGTGDETCLGWPGRLCAAAKSDDASFTYYPPRGREPLRGNLGVRRNTSADILQRWEHETSLRLPDSCDGRVVLSCGVNDMVIETSEPRVSVADSCTNVREILLGASSKYKTIMVGPAPVGDADLNTRLKSLSDAYAQQAKALNIPFIEIYTHLVADRKYLQESKHNDGYHPKSYGYNAIADIVCTSGNWWFEQ